MARAMLENDIPKHFWANVVNTTFYILNRTLIQPFSRKASMSYRMEPSLSFITFMSLSAIFSFSTTKIALESLILKLMMTYFLDIHLEVKPINRVYNKNSRKVEETMHVVFCETNKNCMEEIELRMMMQV